MPCDLKCYRIHEVAMCEWIFYRSRLRASKVCRIRVGIFQDGLARAAEWCGIGLWVKTEKAPPPSFLWSGNVRVNFLPEPIAGVEGLPDTGLIFQDGLVRAAEWCGIGLWVEAEKAPPHHFYGAAR